jgi:polyisoprenoid-binding protein YceI
MRRLLAILLLLLATGGASAQPVVYHLDPMHSFVHFEVMHFGTSTIRGRIGPVEGAVTLDRAARSGHVALRIPVATVDTGLSFFNTRLREPDLLATDEYPEAYFVSSNFRFNGDRLVEVRGEFTLRNVSRPLALQVRNFGCHAQPQSQQEVCGGDFEGEVLRSQFGASFGVPFVSDRVKLVVQAEGVRGD